MFGHVTYRTSRRAASVPIEPVRLIEDTQAANTARRISNAARDDTDALMAASKRHDRELLKDINARLANQSLQAPPVGVVKRSTVSTTTGLRKPPLPPAGRSTTTTTTVYSTTTPRRSTASRYAADPDDDIDAMPPTPVTKSVIRASSVPPRLPVASPLSTRTTSYTVSHVGPYVTSSRPMSPALPLTSVHGPSSAATTWTMYSNGVNNEYAATENPELFGYVPTRVTNPPGVIGPVADLAIRQAHRNLDRIERELKYTPETNGPTTYRYLPKSYPDYSYPDNVAVRRSAYRVTPTSGPISSIRVRHASLSPMRGSGGATYHRVVPAHREVSPLRPSELISLVSSPQPPVKIIQREITTGLTPKIESETRETVFPTRAYRHRTEPPPSLPSLLTVAGAPRVSVGKATAKRYTDLDLAPIPQPSTNVRPKMSDTRRKVRDVLCKVKNDPHYFD